MRRDITLGDKVVPMEANAAIPIRFKWIFGENLFSYFNQELGGDVYTEFAGKLAFVMAKSAEKADMRALTVDDYWAWLETLTGPAIAYAAPDIVDLYLGNETATSEPKKKVDQQTGPTQ